MQIRAILRSCFAKQVTQLLYVVCEQMQILGKKKKKKKLPGCCWSLNKKSVPFHCISWCLLLKRPGADVVISKFVIFPVLHHTGCWIDPVSQLWSIRFHLPQLTSVPRLCWDESIRACWRTGLSLFGESQVSKCFGAAEVDILLAWKSLECRRTDSVALNMNLLCSQPGVTLWICLWRISLTCWSWSWRTPALTVHLWLRTHHRNSSVQSVWKPKAILLWLSRT